VGLRITEVHQHTVAHVLRYEPAKALDSLGDALLVGGDDLAEVLWVHARRECSRADQVREHHGDLATFGSIERLWLRRRRRRRGRNDIGKLADRAKHFQPVAEWNSEVSKMLISQIGKDREINAVLGKAFGVLGHAELFEPVRYLLGRWGAHDDNSSSKALASFRSSVSKPSVNQP
jgi:hypothetical protein